MTPAQLIFRIEALLKANNMELVVMPNGGFGVNVKGPRGDLYELKNVQTNEPTVVLPRINDSLERISL